MQSKMGDSLLLRFKLMIPFSLNMQSCRDLTRFSTDNAVKFDIGKSIKPIMQEAR